MRQKREHIVPSPFTLQPYPVPRGERSVQYASDLDYAEARLERLIAIGAREVVVTFRGEQLGVPYTAAEVKHARELWEQETAAGRRATREIFRLRSEYAKAAARTYALPAGKRKRAAFDHIHALFLELLPPEEKHTAEKRAVDFFEAKLRPLVN